MPSYDWCPQCLEEKCVCACDHRVVDGDPWCVLCGQSVYSYAERASHSIVAVAALIAGLNVVTSMLDYCDYCDSVGEVDAEVHGWIKCYKCKGTGLALRV